MLKRLILAVLMWMCVSTVAEARERFWDYCQRGGQKVVTQGLQSAGLYQRTFQSCTLRVYIAGLDASSITAITRAGGTVTATLTDSIPSYAVGSTVVVSGVLDTSFNGTFVIVAVLGSTQITWTQAGVNASSSAGSASLLAGIYSDNLDPVSTVLSNPFTAASDGYFSFYAAAGKYDVQETFVDSTVSPAATTQLTWGDISLCDSLGPHADAACASGEGIRASTYSGSDSCAKIQAAHDSLPSTGGTILADFSGTSLCTTNIILTKPVIIRGLGIGDTVLSTTNVIGVMVTINFAGAAAYKSDSVRFEDFTLDGPAAGAGDGISIIDGVGASLTNVRVKQFGNNGIVLDSSGGGNVNLCLFTNSAADQNGNYGWYLTGANSNAAGFVNTDARENAVGYRIETNNNMFFAVHADDNTSKAVSFASAANFNRGYIYAERQGANDIHFEGTADYNDIYAISAGPNEANPFYVTSTGTNALNGTVYRAPLYKDPNNATRAAQLNDQVFLSAGANAYSHIGVNAVGTVTALNAGTFSGSIEGLRATALTATPGTGGVVANAISLRSQRVFNGGAVTKSYGLLIDAPTGTVTPTTSYGLVVADGAGYSGFGGSPSQFLHLQHTITDPSGSLAGELSEIISTATAVNAQRTAGIWSINTASGSLGNWTNSSPIVGVWSQPKVLVGSVGTLPALIGLLVSPDAAAGTVADTVGVYVVAPSGAATFTAKHGIVTQTGAGKSVFNDSVNVGSVAFLSLPVSPANGDVIYCSDCNKATPCTAGGGGAFAKRAAGSWDCD